MTTLLVLTVGQTDVQFVEGNARRELKKDCCASLHDEIEKRVDGWRLVDSPDEKAKPIESFPPGELMLCTPKLDAVLRYLEEEGITPTTALVLETRRDGRAERGDPRFAGSVLEVRLRDKGVTVHRYAFLRGNERLEDHGEPRDAIIRREVVGRLDRVIRERITAVGPSRIIVATTGGFPALSELVDAVVLLHTPTMTPYELLEVADGSKAKPPVADRAVPRSSEPAISFQARRRVLELVERGNLLGAWAVAEPLEGDEIEREWTQVIKWLACFASSLPIPVPCDITVLQHSRRAVRTALRVELALRSGDIPRAVHGTVAFFEAALWDHLDERIERHPDAEKRRYFKIKAGEAPKGNKLLCEDDCSKDNRKRPFLYQETVDGVDWYRIFDNNKANIVRLVEHYLRRDALSKLNQAISDNVRDLRNDVAHNEPTPALIGDAQRCMENAALWSANETFLSQPLVQNVLRELGVQNPDKLFDDLVSIIRCRLQEAQR